MILPWQHDLFQQLSMQGERMHHALLLYGKSGIGKLAFAEHLARYLLCRQPSTEGACGHCESCHWIDEGAHPDLKILMPLEKDEDDSKSKKKTNKSQQIVIDQVRDLHEALALTQHQSGANRVVLVHPAEALNAAASNALLKLLEEPPKQTVFLLVAHHKHRLLPTILSRCLKVEMPVPNQAQGLAWLNSQQIAHSDWCWQYSGGAPVTIQQWAEQQVDIYSWYQQWRGYLAKGAQLELGATISVLLVQGMEQAINVLQKWMLDLWLSVNQLPVRYHVEDAAQLQRLAKQMDMRQLLTFQQQLNRFKITAAHPLNQELQLEQLLLQYKKLFSA